MIFFTESGLSMKFGSFYNGIKYYIPKRHKKNRRTPVKSKGTAIFLFSNCQRQEYKTVSDQCQARKI